MRVFIGFTLGLIFGFGLIIAQMTNPAKVLGFLDILHGWDPSLALVMASGLMVFGLGFWLLREAQTTPIGIRIQRPKAKGVDAPLLVGSVFFGLGWGLIGLCPGPAMAALFIGAKPVLIFVAAMIAGMALFTAYTKLFE